MVIVQLQVSTNILGPIITKIERALFYMPIIVLTTQLPVNVQVVIVAFPLVVILRDVSTDGKYIGLALLLWSLPTSTLLLIMLPKVITHFKIVHGIENESTVRGSGGGNIRVSGMTSPVSGAVSQQRQSNAYSSSIASDSQRKSTKASDDGEIK